MIIFNYLTKIVSERGYKNNVKLKYIFFSDHKQKKKKENLKFKKINIVENGIME